MAATRREDLRNDAGFRHYLAAVGKYPVLSRESEVALARRYREGDARAGNELVTANLRFVVRIAMGFRGYGLRVADLCEEGNLGLLEAVKRFEPERGYRFMTYGAYWIRAFILAYVLKQWSLVGVGGGPLQSKLFFRLSQERARISARLGPEGLNRRLARKFGTTEERIHEMMGRLDRRDFSLDQPTFADGTQTALDLLADGRPDLERTCADAERDHLVRERVNRAMKGLDLREAKIVRERLLCDEPETLAEIGRELGVSRERVRQLEERVKAKLRVALDDLQESATQ